MEKQRIIIGPERFSLTIEQLCPQLVEEFDDFSNTCIIGILLLRFGPDQA